MAGRVDRAIKNFMDDESEYDIAIARVSGTPPADDHYLRRAIEATLRRHHIASAQISVALVDDAHIAHLNQTHLDHQGSTDVLTFDLRDDDAPGKRRAPAIEGEIVLSVETAARESAKRGHDATAELALYAVHGTLHLLGFDDSGNNEAARMHGEEDEILAALGLGAVYHEASRCE